MFVVYSKDGKEHNFIHEVDANEAVASGNFFRFKPIQEEVKEQEKEVKKTQKKNKEQN